MVIIIASIIIIVVLCLIIIEVSFLYEVGFISIIFIVIKRMN